MSFVGPPTVLVISTHLDDAVLSCGHGIAGRGGAVVATVFTDAPPVERLDGWNRATTGRTWAPDTQRIRRDEDAAALALLGADARWLGEHEAEYRPGGQDVGALVALIAACVDTVDPAEVWVPLGVHHADHLAVGDACRHLAAAALGAPGERRRVWRMYLDLPYARSFPGEVAERMATLAGTGLALDDHRRTEVVGPGKLAAVGRYATQLEGVRSEHPEFDRSLADPEVSWRIVPTTGADGPGSPSTVG